MNPIQHVIYKLRNAQISEYPFPHFYVEDVFPADFYSQLLASLPGEEEYAPLSGGYANRKATQAQIPLVEGMMSADFGRNVLQIFSRHFYDRFPNQSRPNFRQELRFIRDSEGYKIGPHTDAPQKVISLLFYLPCSDADLDCGTGIYVPNDGQMTCVGGPHHKFEGFQEVFRAPYAPNSCFGFWKQANSWHAVEKIEKPIKRDVLLFNLYADSNKK